MLGVSGVFRAASSAMRRTGQNLGSRVRPLSTEIPSIQSPPPIIPPTHGGGSSAPFKVMAEGTFLLGWSPSSVVPSALISGISTTSTKIVTGTLRAFLRRDLMPSIFNPGEAAMRFMEDCTKSGIPAMPPETLIEAAESLVLANKKSFPWPQGSLTIQFVATEILGLDLGETDPKTFYLIGSAMPVRRHYSGEPISLSTNPQDPLRTGVKQGFDGLLNLGPDGNTLNGASAGAVFVAVTDSSGNTTFISTQKESQTRGTTGWLLPQLAADCGYHTLEDGNTTLTGIQKLMKTYTVDVLCINTSGEISPVGTIKTPDGMMTLRQGDVGSVTTQLRNAMDKVRMEPGRYSDFVQPVPHAYQALNSLIDNHVPGQRPLIL